jgi:hypothetical protein
MMHQYQIHMKKLLLLLSLSVSTLYSQERELSMHYLVKWMSWLPYDTVGIWEEPWLFEEPTVYNLKVGSCASPDGPATVTNILPPNYQYLFDNNYCLYSFPTTTSFTACFTFVAGSSSVDINAGYTQSCNNVQFSNFRLFDATCTQIATGNTYTGLVIGQTYTWCLTMRAFGGPSCNGFSTFCPYYINNTVLPVQLVNFSVHRGNRIVWTTSSELDSDYFLIEYSVSGEFTEQSVIEKVLAAGNTTQTTNYEVLHTNFQATIGYYRLVQVDRNGEYQTYGPIAIDNRTNKELVRTINSAGQQVPSTTSGIVFDVWSDGTVTKRYQN